MGRRSKRVSAFRESVDRHRPVEVDAAFDRIEPLRYPFLAAIENSSLPRRVDDN